jgi:hypothetical protein
MISNYGKYIGRHRVAVTSEYPSFRLTAITYASCAKHIHPIGSLQEMEPINVMCNDSVEIVERPVPAKITNPKGIPEKIFSG